MFAEQGLNKVDKLKATMRDYDAKLDQLQAWVEKRANISKVYVMSALHSHGIDDLKSDLLDMAPKATWQVMPVLSNMSNLSGIRY